MKEFYEHVEKFSSSMLKESTGDFYNDIDIGYADVHISGLPEGKEFDSAAKARVRYRIDTEQRSYGIKDVAFYLTEDVVLTVFLNVLDEQGDPVKQEEVSVTIPKESIKTSWASGYGFWVQGLNASLKYEEGKPLSVEQAEVEVFYFDPNK